MAVGVVASVGTEVITGQWENADMAAVLRDPTYVILTTVSETFQAAFSATVVASLYVELRQWKEGDSVESLEQVFA